MGKRSRRFTAAILATVLLSHQTLVYAGWMDDWIESKSSSTPGYFSGQARGYATAGSFSARWPSRTDYPVSVQSPRLSAGCGGIDFFGGSVSFLKGDQLVAKMQRILQNSEGVAFDMALDTLCPKCSAIMKSMEDLSSKMNSMAMNDCQAAKGLVTGLRPMAEGIAESFKEGMSSEAVTSGVSDSYNYFKGQLPTMSSTQDIQKWWNNQKGQAPSANTKTMGCAGILADLFPADENQIPAGGLSVMSVIGNRIGLPAEHIALMRGLVGDIAIEGAAKGYNVEYFPACPRNRSLKLDQLRTGDVDQMDDNWSCQQATASQGDLEQYVSNIMMSIAGKLKSGSTLDAAEIAFVQNTPVAVLYGMRVAVGSGQEAALISSLSGITASSWMAKSLEDLLARSAAILRVASKTNGSLVNGKDSCNLSVYGESFKLSQKDLNQKISEVSRVLNENMSQQFQEFESTMTIANHLQAINDQIKAQVARTFGPSIAARATRGL